MQPSFNVVREHDNQLRCYRYRNDKCMFQFHSQIEIYMIDEGEMEMMVNGQKALLKAGDVSVALSHDTHMYRTPQASRSRVILIPPHLCEEFALLTRGKRVANPFISDRAVYEGLNFCHQELRKEGISDIRRRGYVYVILGLLAEHLTFEETNVPKDIDLATRLLLYIDKNFRNEITPSSVAEDMGYSQAYLARYFKRCFGITMGSYLTMLRLKNALILMREGGHEIAYCAMESGFTSMRTFYRAFHEEFGCSPKEYIERREV